MSGVLARVLGGGRRDLPEVLRRMVQRKIAVEPHAPIGEVDYVAFDTELTGLDPKRDTIISIGAVRLRGGRIFPGQTFYRLVRPESELRPESVVVHELMHSDLESADRASEGVGLRRSAVDTATLHDWLIENDPKFAGHYGGISLKKDLFSTATRYGIAVDRAHDALFDAFVAGQLFQRLLGFLPANGVRTLKELLEVARP
jgi:DNA polymerase-3 subunit epsilon